MEEAVQYKQYKKIFSWLGFCYAIGTAVVYLLQFVVGYGVSSWKPEWLSNVNINLVLSCLIVYGVGMPLIVLLALKLSVQRPERHKMKWWQFVLALMICYALMIVSNLFGVVITTIIGIIKGSPVQNDLLEVVTSGNMLLNFVAMVIVAPIVEEFVFRKVLVDRTLRYGQGIAIVVSGLMFGLFHGNLNQFVYAMTIGCFFAFLYIKTGNIKITMGMHAVVNFMGSIIAPVLLKWVDLDEILDSTAASTSGEMVAGYAEEIGAILAAFADNWIGWAVYMLYAFFIFAVVVTGGILFIVALCTRRFKLEPVEGGIPKGKRFSTVVLNPGMLVFIITWIILIILQLLA